MPTPSTASSPRAGPPTPPMRPHRREPPTHAACRGSGAPRGGQSAPPPLPAHRGGPLQVREDSTCIADRGRPGVCERRDMAPAPGARTRRCAPAVGEAADGSSAPRPPSSTPSLTPVSPAVSRATRWCGRYPCTRFNRPQGRHVRRRIRPARNRTAASPSTRKAAEHDHNRLPSTTDP